MFFKCSLLSNVVRLLFLFCIFSLTLLSFEHMHTHTHTHTRKDTFAICNG